MNFAYIRTALTFGSVIATFFISDLLDAAPGDALSFTKIADGIGGLSTDTFQDSDQFGLGTTNIGDLDKDGIPDLAVSAPGDDTGGDRRGAVYILLLNADGSAKSSVKIADGQGGIPADTFSNVDNFGIDLCPLGDLDGDDVIDLAVTAYRDDTGGDQRGALYILFLNANGTVKSFSKIADGAGGIPSNTLMDGDQFGHSIAYLGDVDEDLVPDVAVGAPLDDTNGDGRGAIHILYLTTSGTVKSMTKIADGVGGLAEETLADTDNFGITVASLGDVDGDGNIELAVGARNDDTGGPNIGAVHILFLNSAESVITTTKITNGTGGLPIGTLENDDSFGRSVSGLGDLNGDSIPDLAVGTPSDNTGGSGRGAVYFLFLNQGGTVDSFNKIADGTGGLPSDTLVNIDGFGANLEVIGDIDGDRIQDIAVGSFNDDTGGNARGAVYVIHLDGIPPRDLTRPLLTYRTPSSKRKLGAVSRHGGTAVDPETGIASVRYKVPGSRIRSALFSSSSGQWSGVVRLKQSKRKRVRIVVFATNGDHLVSVAKRSFRLK